MTEHGHIKRVFPGGNTSKGFHSFYDYIIGPEATRIFAIKGGPGVGKSTFMRYIGEKMLEQGFDVEYHCCSSDNGSLDGVVIPALGVAMIDGTAPHIVDPKNPGAVDEIIHLGDFWNEEGMRKNREPILRINREVGRLFRRAYNYLAQAKLLNDDLESYYWDSDCLNIAGLNDQANDLINKIFPASSLYRKPKDRHLFASAITPEGPFNYFASIFDVVPNRYILTGPAGTGKSTIARKIYDAALSHGCDVEAYHCSLNPDKIEHLVIPGLDTAVITSVSPHTYRTRLADVTISTEQFVDRIALQPFVPDLGDASRRLQEALQKAFSFIKRAKATHDEMETYYVPNMDFERINQVREATLERIIGYSKELGY
ncbi:MAG: PRK06851 family protein [Bacillota bacterium]